jgi:transposase, IS5 family
LFADRSFLTKRLTIVIIDRYNPVNLFDLVPKLSLEMDAELSPLDSILDDDVLFQRVRADLARRCPNTATHGRHSTPVAVILRLLVVKRLYDWSYEETEHFVSDSLVLRQFCRIYLESVPDDTTLIRWANLIGPGAIEQLNERVVELARSLKVTRGRKLRVDSTAVETNIHHPTDSGILGDGVRVVSRLLHRAKEVVGEGTELGKELFRSRTRTARRVAQQLHRLARRKGEEAAEEMKAIYAKLIDVAQASRAQAERVREGLRERSDGAAKRLVEGFDHFLPLVDQAISQATRRVLMGESVPAKEKLLSLFEPHTQVIQRHKAGKAVEFGRKLWIEEVEGGIVSGYSLAEGGGQDYPYLAGSLKDHKRRFGKPPRVLAGDRGVYTPGNDALAKREGVVRVAIPFAGKAPPDWVRQEREPWFRRGFRFRAGIEGRINVLRRDYGLDCCLEHGEQGMGRWVGWGIVTHNLAKIAETVAARPVTRPAKAA